MRRRSPPSSLHTGSPRARPRRSHTATSTIQLRPWWKSTVSTTLAHGSVSDTSRPTSSRSSSARSGSVVAARVALDPVVGAARSRRSPPGTCAARDPRLRRTAGRAGSGSDASRSPRCASTRRRRTGCAARRAARRARAAAAGSRPSTHTPIAFRVGGAVRLAHGRLVVGRAGRPRPRRGRAGRPVASSRPSATASSTPWPIPSCAAPHVIVWWRSSSAVALFIISVGGQTGSYSCLGRRRRSTSTGVWPGAGCASMRDRGGRSRAPAAREHDVDVRSRSGASPPQPSPIRPSRSSRSSQARARRAAPRPTASARTLARPPRAAAGARRVGRAEVARCGTGRACAGSRARASTSRRSSRARAAPSAGSSAPAADSTASARGMPISTAAPRARVERNAASIASGRPVASIA